MDTWRSEENDLIQITLVVGGEIADLICELLKISQEELISNGIKNDKLKAFSHELTKHSDKRMRSLKAAVELFVNKNLDIRGTSQGVGCGMILSQGNIEPVVFTELPKAESPLYRMFKFEHTKKPSNSAYFKRGTVVNQFPSIINRAKSF